MALPLDRAHAVLQCAPPCAHQRHGNASHKAIAKQKRRGGEVRKERQIAKRPAFHKPVRVKGSIEYHTFHKPMRQRAVCAKRSANGKANAPPWVRARGRALRHCLLAEQLQTICSAIGEEPLGLGAFGRCHWGAISEGGAGATTRAIPAQPEAARAPLPRRPHAIGSSMALQLAVRPWLAR